MWKKRFSNIVTVLTATVFFLQSAGCAERTLVVHTVEPSQSAPDSKPEKAPSAISPKASPAVQKRQKPRLFLVSDLWFGRRLAGTPENPAGGVDPETYRAQKLAEFTEDLNRSAKPKKPTGFDHFLNQAAGWGGYVLFAVALAGWLAAHH